MGGDDIHGVDVSQAAVGALSLTKRDFGTTLLGQYRAARTSAAEHRLQVVVRVETGTALMQRNTPAVVVVGLPLGFVARDTWERTLVDRYSWRPGVFFYDVVFLGTAEPGLYEWPTPTSASSGGKRAPLSFWLPV